MADEFEEVLELGPEQVTEEEPLPAAELAAHERLPALVETRVVEQPAPALLPVVQAAAAAATGFVAGAAAWALVRRHHARRLARASERSGPIGYVRTRTYLVHVRVFD